MKSRVEDDQNADAGRVNAAVMANSLQPVQPSIVATGLHTHADRYNARRSATTERFAEGFLVNSRLRRGDAEMGLSVRKHADEPASTLLSRLGWEGRRGGRSVPLPPSVEMTMTVGEVFQRRRSVRTYSGENLPVAVLATIVRAACGVTAQTAGGQGGPVFRLRSAPSGGGLYPIALQVAALRVEGLDRGLYLYDPNCDELWQTGSIEDVEALLDALALPGQVITEKEAGAVCLLVGRPWRSMRKYGGRGMRYVFLEAGAVAEHINLAAAALGVGSVNCGSFYDDEVHEALEVDGLYEALIHSVFLGMPA